MEKGAAMKVKSVRLPDVEKKVVTITTEKVVLAKSNANIIFSASWEGAKSARAGNSFY